MLIYQYTSRYLTTHIHIPTYNYCICKLCVVGAFKSRVVNPKHLRVKNTYFNTLVVKVIIDWIFFIGRQVNKTLQHPHYVSRERLARVNCEILLSNATFNKNGVSQQWLLEANHQAMMEAFERSKTLSSGLKLDTNISTILTYQSESLPMEGSLEWCVLKTK